jgi:hypothetical protein
VEGVIVDRPTILREARIDDRGSEGAKDHGLEAFPLGRVAGIRAGWRKISEKSPPPSVLRRMTAWCSSAIRTTLGLPG